MGLTNPGKCHQAVLGNLCLYVFVHACIGMCVYVHVCGSKLYFPCSFMCKTHGTNLPREIVQETASGSECVYLCVCAFMYACACLHMCTCGCVCIELSISYHSACCPYVCPVCNVPMGLTNPEIVPSKQLQASSVLDLYHSPDRARIYT